jgi:hypothetical protein
MSIPEDILFDIFSYLPKDDLIKIPTLSKTFQQIYDINKNYIYFKVFQNMNLKVDINYAAIVFEYYNRFNFINNDVEYNNDDIEGLIEELLFNTNVEDIASIFGTILDIEQQKILNHINNHSDSDSDIEYHGDDDMCDLLDQTFDILISSGIYINKVKIMLDIMMIKYKEIMINNINELCDGIYCYDGFDSMVKEFRSFISILWYLYKTYNLDNISKLFDILVLYFYETKDNRLFTMVNDNDNNYKDVLDLINESSNSLSSFITDQMSFEDVDYVAKFIKVFNINIKGIPDFVDDSENELVAKYLLRISVM